MADAPKFYSLLRILARHEVDFIVVGGVAALLDGAPISTFDLDIVYDKAQANLERLIEALGEVDAHYRDPAGRIIPPTVERLAHGGHHLLKTRYGLLDVLSTIGKGRTYEELREQTHGLELEDFSLRLLDLPVLIETKEEANRPKDHAVLPILRQLLNIREQDEGGDA